MFIFALIYVAFPALETAGVSGWQILYFIPLALLLDFLTMRSVYRLVSFLSKRPVVKSLEVSHV